MTRVLHPELSYKICGLCFKTQNTLGHFLSEKAYADYLEGLLKTSGLKYVREYPIPKSFETERSRRNVVDFIIEDKVLVDIKAKRLIVKEDYYQMKRYLVASSLNLGLIINFHQKYLAPKRVLN